MKSRKPYLVTLAAHWHERGDETQALAESLASPGNAQACPKLPAPGEERASLNGCSRGGGQRRSWGWR